MEAGRPPSLPDKAAWRRIGFNDKKWESGSAPSFYGKAVVGGTELGKMHNRYSSVFLRQSFEVKKAGRLSNLNLRAIVDDGFVAWINGVEVARYNVPTKEPTATSVAVVDADEPHSFMSFSLDVPGTLLVDGPNILAVLALNVNRKSDDFLFDAALVADLSLPPLVVRVNPPDGFSVGKLDGIEVQFSQPVKGVDTVDLQVNGQPATTVIGSGAGPYQFKFAALPDGVAHVTWDEEHAITSAAAPFPPLESTAWIYDVAG